ncbi:MAG: hypothetical protein VX589_15385 [Myxococcota bacterium]|nr:hypothetical protein [Myxococcota bacterium]
MADDREGAAGHYRTAGTSLILLGVINSLVAAFTLLFSSEDSFIGHDMMLTFGIAFMAVGYWMRSESVDE